MNALISFLAVVALIGIGMAAGAAGLGALFGVGIPYVAILLFLGGVIWRVVTWAKSPVPFRIPTTAGQQRSLSFLGGGSSDNPATRWGAFKRMVLEILFFRSLFRNTRSDMKKGPKIVYGADRWLWLASLVFHWAFLVVLLRHLRFFTEPIPAFVLGIEGLDRFFEVTVPALYLTDVLLILGLGYLLWRRFADPQVRYVSLASDYFPLFLLLGIALTGVFLRYFAKADVIGIKELSVGLVTLSPVVPAGPSPLFFAHLFLVSTLIGYFPFSKLVHAPGVFFSPTRNLANDNRIRRHVNPWNPEVRFHTFDEWKEEFTEEIEQAGYELKGEK